MASAPAPVVRGLWDLFDLTTLFESGLQTYLVETLERSAHWFRASGGSIFLLDPKSGEHTLRAATGTQRHLSKNASVRIGHGIAGLVLQTGEPRIIEDPTKDPLFKGSGIQRNQSLTSAMVVPLVGDDGLAAGVINLSRTLDEPPYTLEELDLASTLGAQVVLAVTNAQIVSAMAARENDLRAMNEKLTAVLDSVAGAVVVVDDHGDVVNHNRAAAEDSFLTGGADADLSEVQNALKLVTHETLKVQRPTRHQAHESGADRTWLVEGVPLRSGGAVVTVKETTAIERQNREVARVKRLAEIGQMTAAVAHEIRNPLTGIRSAAAMIGQDPAMTQELVQMIEEEVLRLNDLCEDFLEFARPLQIHPEPTDVAELCRAAVLLVGPDFDEVGVSLRVEVAPGLPKIELDPRRIKQVVVNLLRNAAQASPRGNTVRLSADANSLKVEDEGAGMTEDQLGRLFSPFFTTKADGTGLGLSTARKIMDAHGGSIRVESAPGKGSTFELTWEAPRA
ncbi:MAG: GAF domain-containing protein [Fimbriimonadaceae bacterium]|nr:GAF domain-containing protein [Fimbriimonadaceae bacterium]